MTTGEIILGALVVGGFSASYWALARIADALNQIDSRSERIQQSVERTQQSVERAQQSVERTQLSVERIAQYLAAGPRG